MSIHLRLSSSPLYLQQAHDFVVSPECGAIATFSGTTRADPWQSPGAQETSEDTVELLEYECYEPMALRKMQSLVEACQKSFPGVKKVWLEHRLGPVRVCETSILIAASSAHRREALEAVDFLIEGAKKDLPIWKRELCQGRERWKENKEWKPMLGKSEGGIRGEAEGA